MNARRNAPSDFHVARRLLRMWETWVAARRLDHLPRADLEFRRYIKYHSSVRFSAWKENQKYRLHAESEMVDGGRARTDPAVSLFCESSGCSWSEDAEAHILEGLRRSVFLEKGRYGKQQSATSLLRGLRWRWSRGVCHDVSRCMLIPAYTII